METFPILHTERLDLIEIGQNHLEDLYKIFGDAEVMKYYNIIPLTALDQAQQFIDHFQLKFSQGQGIRWGIALKGTSSIIGTIGFNNYIKSHRSNIGYDLQKTYWNNGYTTEALKEIVRFGFDELQVNRIEAEVMQGNVASENLLNRLNFKNEGILKDWMFWNNKYYDMTMFALLRSEKQTN